MEERKANWSESSTHLLVDLVTDPERWAIIRGKFGPSLTIQTKQKAWIEITERVNSCSSCIRSLKDVKKKWQDLQSHTKKKAANRKSEMKKTGGGPSPPELKTWEEKIVAVLSNDVISGVEGGFESPSVMSSMDNCMPGCSKKRKFDEPLEGCDAPSIVINKPLPTVAEDVSEVMSTSSYGFCQPEKALKTISANSLSASSRISNDRTASKRKDSTVKDPTKDRLMEIEEEKLVIMKEHLKIERRKVDILEDYVNWRKKMYTEGMENTCTPTVSPIIRGIFTS